MNINKINHSEVFAIEFDGSLFEIGSFSELVEFSNDLRDELEFATPDDSYKSVSRDDAQFIEWITIASASELSGISHDTLRGAARRENFRTVKDASGRFQINRASLITWLANREAR